MCVLYGSALGAYDGNAYENLWKRAQEEPLNRSEVPDCYEVSSAPSSSMDNAHAIMYVGEHQADASAWSTSGWMVKAVRFTYEEQYMHTLYCYTA